MDQAKIDDLAHEVRLNKEQQTKLKDRLDKELKPEIFAAIEAEGGELISESAGVRLTRIVVGRQEYIDPFKVEKTFSKEIQDKILLTITTTITTTRNDGTVVQSIIESEDQTVDEYAVRDLLASGDINVEDLRSVTSWTEPSYRLGSPKIKEEIDE